MKEILEKIIKEALLSSAFLWPGHVCDTNDNLQKVSVHFRDITPRVAWTLPKIHCPNGIKNGMLSVRTLLKKSGFSSGITMEVKRIVAFPNWKNAYLDLQICQFGWFLIRTNLLEKKEQN